MKKILGIILGIFMLFSFLMPVYGNCSYDEEFDTISSDLSECFRDSKLVGADNTYDDMTVEGEFKNTLNKWTKAIGGFLGLLAIGSIVYGAFLMTTSAGEDEALKKAKDVIKWGIIGFLAVLFASSIIALVVNIMYSL